MEKARSILPQITEKWIDKISRFLDTIDMKEEAFKIVIDKEHKFDLSLALNKIDDAFEIAQESNNAS